MADKGFEGFLSLEPHLTDFVGLQGLEKSVEQRGRTDGEYAFCQAYEALSGLLSVISVLCENCWECAVDG